MKFRTSGTFAAISIAASCGIAYGAADDGKVYEGVQRPVIVDGRIGYVMTHRAWAVQQSPEGKVECPAGYNDGPREQFKQLFPSDGTKRTLVETQIMREARQWFPDMSEEPFPFKEATGKVSYGMNLDGKEGPEDFTDPDGVKGVDNQLFRAIGCVSQYRAPSNLIFFFENKYLGQYNQNRFMFEITGVDSLSNDDDVTVTTYRGRDDLLADATGASYVPGGTQRVDARWGKMFQQSFKGVLGFHEVAHTLTQCLKGTKVLVTAPQGLLLVYGAC